jgi:hypothetical protein
MNEHRHLHRVEADPATFEDGAHECGGRAEAGTRHRLSRSDSGTLGRTAVGVPCGGAGVRSAGSSPAGAGTLAGRPPSAVAALVLVGLVQVERQRQH